MGFTAQDERFMRRALALARRGQGRTSPNPAVGAVLVRNGRIIGEGWHRKAGGPHAEVFALRQCCGSAFPGATGSGRTQKGAPTKTAAYGGTLYVTMEPCCTWGKTPPCTDAIIAAGVRRVVVAALDPNPQHDGRGLKVLRHAGIRVDAGLLAEEATRMNAAFNKWVTTEMPFVIAKAAMSLDGKIATRTGDSKWITSDTARRAAHKLRANLDAIMVGANTVIRDNPQLTLRHGVRGRQPLRIVMDARGRSPLDAQVFTDKFHERTVVVTSTQSSKRWRQQLTDRGVRVLRMSHRDLRGALLALAKLNVTSVLVEGGGELLGSMFDASLVDKVVFFYAPVVIGGREAVTPVAGRGVGKIAHAVRLRDCRWRRLGKAEMVFEATVAR